MLFFWKTNSLKISFIIEIRSIINRVIVNHTKWSAQRTIETYTFALCDVLPLLINNEHFNKQTLQSPSIASINVHLKKLQIYIQETITQNKRNLNVLYLTSLPLHAVRFEWAKGEGGRESGRGNDLFIQLI